MREELDPLMSPNRYIEKVSLLTGEVLDEDIEPKQLLVSHHRDYHVVDVQARRFMAKIVRSTGDPEAARSRMKEVRSLGYRTAEVLAKALGKKDPSTVGKALFGLKKKEYYFRYKRHPLTAEQITALLEQQRAVATAQLDKQRRKDGSLGIRVLLTGGTGFVGKEFVWQAVQRDNIAEIVVLIRPKKVFEKIDGKKVAKVLSPADRGAKLLEQLWIESPELREKVRFIAGDVEEPNLGVSEDDFQTLATTLTHVIHCAASVSFDDTYENSFRANVAGTLNALAFSERLQKAPKSPFVAHISIETSYIHGRQVRDVAREDEIVFPRNFYNNYYELTKAMASIETERFQLEKGLRVAQLCPAIVIGESRGGNNRGDTKVVNAPVNVFGRAHEALTKSDGSWIDRSKGAVIARMACIFPGDPNAELNLIPVDWVVKGMIAALERPAAVGERVHLATDNRLTSDQIRRTVKEELGVNVRLAEPTLHRNVTLPMLSKLLSSFKQERLAKGLEKLGTIFGGYSEWGQPIHEVGRDQKILGLPKRRPNTEHAFRMLCRHNKYVQKFGEVRDDDEISRRERVWIHFIIDLEGLTGGPVGAMKATEFRRAVEEMIDLERFVPKNRPHVP